MLKMMPYIFSCIALVMLLLPIQKIDATTTRVDANQYSSFWIWGRIQSAPYLQQAKELYILQGEIRLNNTSKQSVLIPQGIGVLKIPHQKVWLVYRNHHLQWNNQELVHILKRIQSWENAGNNIQGIQIDFDAQTKNLNEYAIFLQKLRSQLPQKYKLSITGLLDWSNVQNQETLNLLRQNIDELAIQSYQGSTTIPNYQNYLKKISAMKLPYKIGIVQHGIWDKSLNFNSDPNFKGYIVFLLRNELLNK
jgi:hypothetical protein